MEIKNDKKVIVTGKKVCMVAEMLSGIWGMGSNPISHSSLLLLSQHLISAIKHAYCRN